MCLFNLIIIRSCFNKKKVSNCLLSRICVTLNEFASSGVRKKEKVVRPTYLYFGIEMRPKKNKSNNLPYRCKLPQHHTHILSTVYA